MSDASVRPSDSDSWTTSTGQRLPVLEGARNFRDLGGYRAGDQRLPYEQAPAYRELFRRLVCGDIPLVLNCSAGKDRAGTAAALILSALGVARGVVVEDYPLTDKVVGLQHALLTRRWTPLSQQPTGVVDAILAADPEYIRVALASVEANSGSLDAYLQQQLDVGPMELERMKKLLL